MKVLIAGATGNMGEHLIKHLLAKSRHGLRLLVHKTAPLEVFLRHPRVELYYGSLADPISLRQACHGVDAVISSAGVLFQPFPERFLRTTNVTYVRNLVDAAIQAKVGHFILASFPHVEGETTPQRPALGILGPKPDALHAATRWEAEDYLFKAAQGTRLRPLALRAGFVYGPDVRLMKGARWLLRHRLMAVWRKPTWIHLLSIQDYCEAMLRSLDKPRLIGIVNLCDEQPTTLQDFLDKLADHWGYPRPRRLPVALFWIAAVATEVVAFALRLPCPLHRDLLKMGMTSSVANTSRMKATLLPKLSVPNFKKGIQGI
jgi:nucleoside-diphosphate-sugar epimerase